MKKIGSILEFTNRRNSDILRAVRHQISLADTISMPDIFRLAAESPAERFWVSEERAAAVISIMERKMPFPKMRYNKREMFLEIYRRYLAARKIHPGKSPVELISQIVNEPAPKFYLTPRTFGELYYRILNGFYDKTRQPR